MKFQKDLMRQLPLLITALLATSTMAAKVPMGRLLAQKIQPPPSPSIDTKQPMTVSAIATTQTKTTTPKATATTTAAGDVFGTLPTTFPGRCDNGTTYVPTME